MLALDVVIATFPVLKALSFAVDIKALPGFRVDVWSHAWQVGVIWHGGDGDDRFYRWSLFQRGLLVALRLALTRRTVIR